MAIRGKSVCRHPGCGLLLDTTGYCAAHIAQHRKASDARRGSSSERGYNHKWQKARATFLARSPWCVDCCSIAGIDAALPETVADECMAHGVRLPWATIVDHIVAHKGDQTLFWDTSNWQSLCKTHHDQKTAREDGGFGRYA
jgi:5-methylcytosine-specific restriction protein A